MTHPRISSAGRRLRDLACHPATRATLAVASAVVGLGTVVLAMAVGHCSFAGGRCPADPVALWENDAFGTAAVGLVLVVAVPLLARRPDRRGVRIALLASFACLPVAWLIAEAARTGGA